MDSKTERPAYQAIIVLAAGILDSGELPQNAKLRVQQAKRLYDLGYSKNIIMSGRWSKYRETHRPPRTEAEAMSRYAQTLGIAREHLHKEERSHTTQENAFYCLEKYLRPNNWKRILVVTSDFHLPRAQKVFESLLDSSYTVRYVGAGTQFHPWKWLVWTLQEKVLWKTASWWKGR